MKITRITVFAAAVTAIGFSGCSSGDSTAALLDLLRDTTVTADVAAIAADAFAIQVAALAVNGSDPAMSAVMSSSLARASSPWRVSRDRTCFDANGAVVAGCKPFSSVRKIVTKMKIDGGRSGTRKTTGGATVTWTGVIHRSSLDTLIRLFSGTTDTAHVHGDVATSNDTSTFSDGTVSRLHAESSFDTVKAVRNRLPRSQNPWPVAGSIVRVTKVHATVTKDGKTASKDFIHTIEIIFPPDAQGNVTFKINNKTCKLNLTTRVISNCTP